jgi:hypothetical protein
MTELKKFKGRNGRVARAFEFDLPQRFTILRGSLVVHAEEAEISAFVSSDEALMNALTVRLLVVSYNESFNTASYFAGRLAGLEGNLAPWFVILERAWVSSTGETVELLPNMVV